MPYDSPFDALAALRKPDQVVLASTQNIDAVSGVLAAGQLRFNTSNWPEGSTFQFIVTLSVTDGAITGTAVLYNLTDGEVVTGTSLSTSSLTTVTLTSGSLTVGSAAGNLQDSTKIYEVRLSTTGVDALDIVNMGTASLYIV